MGLIEFGCLGVVSQFPRVLILELLDLLLELRLVHALRHRLAFFFWIPYTIVFVFIDEVLGLTQFTLCSIVKYTTLNRERCLVAPLAVSGASIVSSNRFDTILEVAPGGQLVVRLVDSVSVLIIGSLPLHLSEAFDRNDISCRIIRFPSADNLRLVSHKIILLFMGGLETFFQSISFMLHKLCLDVLAGTMGTALMSMTGFLGWTFLDNHELTKLLASSISLL